MLFGLSLLELVELCAGAGYCVQLTATAQDFLKTTFEPPAAAPDAIAMCNYSGAFLAAVYAMSTLVLLKGAESLKPTLYLIKALTWGGCGLLTYKHWDVLKKPNVYVNLGLQAAFFTLFGIGSALA